MNISPMQGSGLLFILICFFLLHVINTATQTRYLTPKLLKIKTITNYVLLILSGICLLSFTIDLIMRM